MNHNDEVPKSQRYYTIREAAEELGMHTSTLYGFLHRGHFPGLVQMGGRRGWFIPEEDVEAIRPLCRPRKTLRRPGPKPKVQRDVPVNDEQVSPEGP